MFDLSVLPYIVFAFMAIPPFIFGYFKGWRSGLFTLLLTLVTGGILVGICAGIYSTSLWPLYKSMFMKDNALDIESLKEISRTSVISISVGIALIPTMLIMWGLYSVFKKLLNKYMLPKIKKISKNEVSIQRKNLKYTRIGGVVLNGTAGLIIASAAAGAVSTFTVPSKSSNFFNSMTNVFSDGMTFGQGQYNENYQWMYEFVKNKNVYNKQNAEFGKAFTFSQITDGKIMDESSFTSNLNSFITSLKGSTFLSDTQKAASNSKEISKALVLMLLNSSKQIKDFHLVGFAPDKPLEGLKGKKIDFSIKDNTDIVNTEKVIGSSVESFKLLSNSYSSILKWNREGVKEAFEEYFDKRSIDFKYSPYYYRWLNSQNALEDAKTLLKTMQKQSTDDATNIKNRRDDQTKLVSKIKAAAISVQNDWDNIIKKIKLIGSDVSGSTDYPTYPDKNNIDTKIWTKKWSSIDEDGKSGNPQSFGYIPNLVSIPSLSDGYYVSKVNAFNVNKTNWAKTDAAELLKTTAFKALDDTNKELSRLRTNQANNQRDLDDAIAKKTTAETFLNGYTSLHNQAISVRDNEENNNQDLKTKRDAAEKEKQTKYSDYTTALNQLNTLSATVKQELSDLDALSTKVSDKGKEVSKITTEKNSAEATLQVLEKEYQKAVTIYNAVPSTKDNSLEKARKDESHKKFTDQQKIVNDLNDNLILAENELSSLNTQKTVKETESDRDAASKSTQEKSVETLKNAYADSLSKYNGLVTSFNTSTNKLSEYEQKVTDLESRFSTETNNKSSSEAEIARLTTEKGTLINNISTKEALQKNLDSDYNQKNSVYLGLKGISDASLKDYNAKEELFKNASNEIDNLFNNIKDSVSKAGIDYKNEQDIEAKIKQLIIDKNILDDPTKTLKNEDDSLINGSKRIKPIHDSDHWSIEDQKWTVTDIDAAIKQYGVIKDKEKRLYNSRRESIVNSLTDMLS